MSETEAEVGVLSIEEKRKQKRIVFVHGLEGGPNKWKARFLREHYDCVCPDMSSILKRERSPFRNPLIALIAGSAASTIAFGAYSLWQFWSSKKPLWLVASVAVSFLGFKFSQFLFRKGVQRLVALCYSLQVNSVSHSKPDLVIASSFGGMMAVMMAISGVWKGPLLLLAPAQRAVAEKAGIPLHLVVPPADFTWPVRIIHGAHDTTIPLAHSEDLAQSAVNSHLTVVDDGHSLHKWLGEEDHFLRTVDELLGIN